MWNHSLTQAFPSACPLPKQQKGFAKSKPQSRDNWKDFFDVVDLIIVAQQITLICVDQAKVSQLNEETEVFYSPKDKVSSRQLWCLSGAFQVSLRCVSHFSQLICFSVVFQVTRSFQNTSQYSFSGLFLAHVQKYCCQYLIEWLL